MLLLTMDACKATGRVEGRLRRRRRRRCRHLVRLAVTNPGERRLVRGTAARRAAISARVFDRVVQSTQAPSINAKVIP